MAGRPRNSSSEIENDTTGVVEGREHQASAQLEFMSSDAISVTYTDTYEYLDGNFRIADGVIVPPGGYSFGDVTARLSIGSQRRFSGNVSVQSGGFYGGDKTTVGLQGGDKASPFLQTGALSRNKAKAWRCW